MLEVFPSSSPFLKASPSRRRRLPSHCMSATERQRLVAAALRGGASKIQNKTKMENIDNICEGLYILSILRGCFEFMLHLMEQTSVHLLH